MAMMFVALAPVAMLLGYLLAYLCWQLVRKAVPREPDLGRHVSDGAPGYSPGGAGDTGTFGFFGGGSGGGYCDGSGFSDGSGGCDSGG